MGQSGLEGIEFQILNQVKTATFWAVGIYYDLKYTPHLFIVSLQDILSTQPEMNPTAEKGQGRGRQYSFYDQQCRKSGQATETDIAND